MSDDLDEMPLASLAAYVGLEGHHSDHGIADSHHGEETLVSVADEDHHGAAVPEASHKCVECDKEFPTRRGLLSHRDRIHVLDPALASVIESDSTPHHESTHDTYHHHQHRSQHHIHHHDPCGDLIDVSGSARTGGVVSRSTQGHSTGHHLDMSLTEHYDPSSADGVLAAAVADKDQQVVDELGAQEEAMKARNEVSHNPGGGTLRSADLDDVHGAVMGHDGEPEDEDIMRVLDDPPLPSAPSSEKPLVDQDRDRVRHQGHPVNDDDASAALAMDSFGSEGTNTRDAVASQSAGNVWCSQCTAKFLSPTELSTHLQTKHRSFECSRCEATFSCAHHLAKHVRVIHDRMKEFPCDECGKTFGARGGLNVHKRMVHRAEARFVCAQCGKAFGTKGNLQRHENSLHTHKKTFPCKKCDRIFTQAGDLDRHVRVIHENRRDFVCSHCNKMFGWKRDLKRHVNALHMNHKYQCSICGGELSEKCHLQRHIRRYHPGVSEGTGSVNNAPAGHDQPTQSDAAHHSNVRGGEAGSDILQALYR